MEMAGELFWDRYICGKSQSIILGWDWMVIFALGINESLIHFGMGLDGNICRRYQLDVLDEDDMAIFAQVPMNCCEGR